MIDGSEGFAWSCRVRIAHHLGWAVTTICFWWAVPTLLFAQQPPPEVIYVNGNIYTLDAARARAEALGVAGDRIVAVGSNAEVRKLVQPQTRICDLDGKTVLPGLIDAHCHVASLGSFGLGRIDLSEARSYEDLVAAVAARVKKAQPGEWIVGGRWDHENWPGRKLPTHHKLSEVSPDNPIWLTRVDGHAGLANVAAMKLAGITRDTPDPPGGEVIRDENGDPTGIFVDNAEGLIARHVEAGVTDTAALILKAQEMCLSVGLTGVHDAGVAPAEIEVYRELADSGRLKLRVYAMVAGRAAIGYFKEHGKLVGDRITVRSAKLYVDGALGSRGAWLLEPYSDRPTDAEGKPYTGLAVGRPEFIRMVAEDGLLNGYQVCTHAIGDRGNRETLNAYALALSRHPRQDHRFRIEHAQVLSLEDIPRFAKLGVIPSMQPTHCTSDMRWVYARVGERRAAGAYAWAKLLRTGARIPAGSDFPVESHNPFFGIYAAVTRQNHAGEPSGGWQPEDRMSRAEALRAFTLDAAYAAFEEAKKGSLEVGKLADFIVIDRDIMTCEPRAILETKVLQTVIGGETVCRRSGAP
ncbi:MAG TPA: amidohydrolase [Phycisphaerae bacterium]|nr:amidohydrolase [Phycisphaerae bacterium]